MHIPIDTIVYTYGDESWGDLLTAYDGVAITYDEMGNPLNDGTWTYTWEHGRQLASMTNGSTTWTYTYDANGMRTSRSNGTDTYAYVYNGSKLMQMTVGSYKLTFTYDGSGNPSTVTLNGVTYYYITNLQGDVIEIRNASGALVCNYSYDAWGNVVYTSNYLNNTLRILNPLLYRGYVYDRDTGLYYLQSRYYNPAIGRFLNADALVATGQGMLGNNMFAYCGNNPVSRADFGGCAFVQIDFNYSDNLSILCPALSFGSGGGGCAVYVLSIVDQKFKPEYTMSTGVVIGTSMYGHTQSLTGCISSDTSGDIAAQRTLTIGESTCLTPGVSAGLCKTWSTADDVQHMKGPSSSFGGTICIGIGISIDLVWFESPTGKREYALTVGVIFGAELEAHGAISDTTSSQSWNPFG